MTVAIHQPNFLPWLGFFYKFYLADCFVFLDDAQYSKNSFTNRNKIKTPQGANWLTLPIKSSGKFGQNISEVLISNFPTVKKKILSTIKTNYSKAKYFDEYYLQFEENFYNSTENLSNLNATLILWINKILKIEKKIFFSSQLNNSHGNSTEKLINICKEFNCDTYLSGFGGTKYQDEALFLEAGIKIKLYDFKHPIYSQLWGDFIPNLSIIDLLFNCGPESKEILNSSNGKLESSILI
jgi:hypothetical protein